MADTNPPIELKKKDKVSGKILKATLAGAVVDIGRDRPAVIPISQLSKEAVRRVEDVVKPGDEVNAWVRRINEDKNLVELTLVEPLALEWRDIKKGMKLAGTVSRLETFGAFVEVGAERPGMVHVSEMSHDYVRKPDDVVKVGEEIEVQVLAVDRRKKQIKLSMKALNAPPEELVEEVVEQGPAPTSMELALRKAMEGGDEVAPEMDQPATKKKSASDMEDILNRTLENRVRSK
jgi:ribosomal protein S1